MECTRMTHASITLLGQRTSSKRDTIENQCLTKMLACFCFPLPYVKAFYYISKWWYSSQISWRPFLSAQRQFLTFSHGEQIWFPAVQTGTLLHLRDLRQRAQGCHRPGQTWTSFPCQRCAQLWERAQTSKYKRSRKRLILQAFRQARSPFL